MLRQIKTLDNITILYYYLIINQNTKIVKMRKIELVDLEKVKKLISQNKKFAIFEVDNDGKPLNKASDILYEVFSEKDKKYDILKPAIKYIEENVKSNITLSKLAKLCGISSSYFSGLFFECYQISPYDYVIQKRLEVACKLLKETSYTVVSIALSVGYNDAAYFNRLFKKKFGITPLQYRTSNVYTLYI